MSDSNTQNQSNTEASTASPNSLGAWAVVAVLSVFLMIAAVIGYLGWISTDTNVPTSGYVAMALGTIFSLAVGVGLMTLIFYSSRKGYDEPAVFTQEPDAGREEVQGVSQEDRA